MSDLTTKSIACPYSDDHIIPVADYLLHVAICRRNYYKDHGIRMELKRCKYNGYHYYPAPELSFHEMICHSRALYQQCKEKMRCPPIALHIGDTIERIDSLNDNAPPVNCDPDDVPNLIDFD